jgi:hypothetical protein
MGAARAELESLLRARKLDVTLTATSPGPLPDEEVAPTGCPALDAQLAGGLRRGHLSEVIGPRSAGRSSLVASIAAAATARGEVAAIVDTHDRFDPASAAAAGVDLQRLLWIRETGQPERALKAMNLVLQAGGFGLVVFDLADARPLDLRRFPHTTWMRLSRVIEGSLTIALIAAVEHTARSAGGVTIALEPSTRGEWAGDSARSRRLGGLALRPRVISARPIAPPRSGPGGGESTRPGDRTPDAG